jgi:hypothetical protein
MVPAVVLSAQELVLVPVCCLDILDTKYKFYLAFENSNCQDYITEKFFVNGLG